MSDLDMIIFAIAGVAIILISLYVVVTMTQDINETIRKCNEIGTWAKTNWKGEPMGAYDCDCINNLEYDRRERKAQLSQEGTTSDQPVASDTNVGDKISKFIDGLEEIFADLRERHVDDSVCGLCEYDGAYMGQSGDWCNECPGFEKNDCFKLSDKTRREWTEEIITICKHVGNNSEIPNSSDTISRQAVIDALHTWFRDGFDEDKWWNSTHVLAAIEGLHPVQQEHKWETCFECPLSHGCPKIKGCTNEQAIEYASQIPNDCPLSAQPEPQWIPVSERLPEESGYYITSNEYNGVGEDFYYDGHFWNADKNAYEVIAWMPKPEHYKPNK